MKGKLVETDKIKVFRSPELNFNFDKRNGYTTTWGETFKDNPDFSPYGPMILDMEVTDICKGIGNEGPCPFCYKSNTAKNTSNMTFNTFKNIMDKMPKILTQIAFGVDAQCESNPDIWKMMKYSREIGVIPNVTVADISDEVADKLVEHCGAVAVSRYKNKEYCYDSIKKLTDRGLKQTNMHIMISDETLGQVYETMMDYVNGDERLKGLNAIVLLSLKTKGRGKSFTPLSQDEFSEMVNFALDNNIPIGFDSCGANKFLESVKNRDNFKELEMLSEPCESTCFSAYINTNGNFYPCSFTEKGNGINVEKCDDFLKDVWYNVSTVNFRNKLLKNSRNCFEFKV